MNRSTRISVLGSACAVAALCLCYGTTASYAAEGKGPQPSSFLLKDLKAAQDDQKAGNYAAEIQKLQTALAIPKKRSAYDDYLINSWLAVAYVQTKSYDNAATALQAAAASQYANASQKKTYLSAVVSLYSQLHEYPKAIAAGQKAIEAGVADSDIYVTIAQDQKNIGQHKAAAETLQHVIDKETRPQENYLVFQWNEYNAANDQADARKVIDKLVTYYPKPDYWLNALQPLLKMNINDAHLQLDVYRLMFDVGVMKPMQYGEMAELTFDAGFPGETVEVLQKAFNDHAFTDQRDIMRYQHLLMGAMQKTAQDQASLPAQESKAASAATGDALVAVGAAYLSYGEDAKAASAISQGIAKGGLKYPDEATLLLGIAQLKAHDASEAHRTFDKVANSSKEGYAQLGRLWVLHSQSVAHNPA
jgi:tetratricopeptide (TPR) repeat protein